MSEHSSIDKKLCDVMRAVTSVKKTGEMSGGGNFKFHSREDAFAVRPALAEHGVSVTTRVVSHDVHVGAAGDWHLTTVLLEVAFNCEHTGATRVSVGLGHGLDKRDHGASKAQTNALKNALLNTFLLGEEEHGYQSSASTPEPQEVPAPQENTREAIVAFLSGIGFKTEQIVSFGQWIAARENAPNIKAVPDDRLPVYLASLRKRSEEDARKMVLAKIKSKDAA